MCLKNSCWMLKFHCCAYGQMDLLGMEMTDKGKASGGRGVSHAGVAGGLAASVAGEYSTGRE